MNRSMGPPREPSRRSAWAFCAWRWALLAVMGAFGALYVAYDVAWLDYPLVDRGWTIDHIVHNAWQIVQGQPVYVDPRAGSPTAFMYTPGMSWMLVPLVALFGPELWTARLLNALAALLLIVLLTRETARRVRDRRLVWFAPGLVFLGGAAHGHTLLTAHPENWALAFGFLALLAARRAADTGRGLLWPVLASCAAVATKQTALVYVLAAAAPLAAGRRPARAATFLLAVGGVLALAAAWGQSATDGQFLRYALLAGSQQIDWGRPPLILVYLGYYLGPSLAVLVAAAVLRRAPPSIAACLRDPFLVALVLALPATLLVMAKDTSAGNNLLGPCLLLVPFVLGAADSLLRWFAERPVRAAAAAALCLAWVGLRAVSDLPPLWRHLLAREPARQAAQRLEEIVRAAPGPIWIPADISLAYRHGVPVVSPAAILFEFRFDPATRAPLLAQLQAAAFATILLPDGFFRLLPEESFGPVLRAHYRPVELIESSPWIGSFASLTVLERRP
jgi:4-amino-4-deoxy-L-arabinose transferase-like glycosyltransferase